MNKSIILIYNSSECDIIEFSSYEFFNFSKPFLANLKIFLISLLSFEYHCVDFKMGLYILCKSSLLSPVLHLIVPCRKFGSQKDILFSQILIFVPLGL